MGIHRPDSMKDHLSDKCSSGYSIPVQSDDQLVTLSTNLDVHGPRGIAESRQIGAGLWPISRTWLLV